MRSNRSIIVVLATALFLVAVGCAQHQAPVDQFKETQAQMAELQKSLANMNLRLEELNNSVFILQETSKANRETIRELKRDQQKPTVFITPGPGDRRPSVLPLPQGGGSRIPLNAGFQTNPPANSGIAAIPASGVKENAFESGSRQFREGRYGLAAYDLGAFLAKNPGSTNVPHARFRLAESYYRLGDHSLAAREYGLLLSAGAGSYAAKATVRSAQCFQALGQTAKARSLFKKVVSRYPGTREADVAKKELSKL